LLKTIRDYFDCYGLVIQHLIKLDLTIYVH